MNLVIYGEYYTKNDRILDYFCEGFFIMDELIRLSIQLHLLFIILLVVLIGLNIYLLKSDKTFLKLSKRLELIAPQYYIVLSAIFFTGIIVMAVQQFNFSFSVWIMILVWLLIVAFGIRGHKLYKKIERTEESQSAYKHYAIKKYSIDLLAVIAISILFYMVH
ncbi:hypothetical protein Sdiek1_0195 [Sulfurospirillum diekertiae]|uniref:Uncharacterized protein n=2 Tax=Sulfurospirillum diekertiae TaxID=1854492 RepID=A0A1Y0HH36_9BACT|nr:hypothetical protein Sdiek1_0195 [Sulfurospirillum diekertiae]ASC92229.1 hypothetical protein Sdiek2_0191 [Sulfurospirillum diekertiae]